MPKILIDKEGLVSPRIGPVDAYLDALGLEGEIVSGFQSRLDALTSLRAGAGVVVYTGPSGLAFWQIVSPEVKVRVVPDGYEVSERFSDLREWAYRAVGFSSAVSRQLLTRKTDVPEGDGRYHLWCRARQLLSTLEGNDTPPLIVADFPVEQWGVDELGKQSGLLALDWEWEIETAEPTGMSVGRPDIAAYVPLWASDYDDRSNSDVVLQWFSSYLLGGGRGILHGARADLGTQFRGELLDLVEKGDFDDTMVMAYLCGEPILSLKELARKYLGRDPVAFPGNLSSLPVGLATRYAGADARNTYDLYARFAQILYEREQWGVYHEIERPLVPIVASMEREGVPVSISRVKVAYRDTVAIEQGVRRAIIDNYGLDIAKDSGDSLETNEARQFVKLVTGKDPGGLDQRILTLFPEGGIDLLLLHRRSRTLRRNFLGRALKYHHASNHPEAVRRLFKSRSRFTNKGELTDLGKFLAWQRQWKAVCPDGEFRYFPRFNQAGSMDGENRSAPRSGRFSSADPNIQQQPRNMRDVFVPPEGCLWWSWDYSGLELHIAAALSQDEAMLRTLTTVCPDEKCTHKPKCGDLHATFQQTLLAITGSLMDRSLVKAGNFEQLYGGGAGKLVEIVAKDRTFVPLETATKIVEGHKSAFPGFHRWADERREVHQVLGYATTLMGRRRYIPELRSRDPERQSYGARAGINHEIQGTAADIVKVAMRLVIPIIRKYNAHLAMQVHDELDGWIPEGEDIKAFSAEISEAMVSVPLPGIKLKVEGGVGRSWAEAH